MDTDTKVAVPNYSDEQVALVTAACPLNWEGAKALGLLIGKSPQSIVSKVNNLGLVYVAKPPPRKKAVQATKVELCAEIQKLVNSGDYGMPLEGLEKASRTAILNLLKSLRLIVPPVVETPLPEIGDSAKES
jgi:hypothetical protein